MAANAMQWTPHLLKDVSMALQVSLNRVPASSMRETPVEENWQKARDWLKRVEPFTAQADDAIDLLQIPPFPLSSKELHELQTTVDRIAEQRAATSNIHRSFRRVRVSVILLGVVIFYSAAITAFEVFVFRGTRDAWYIVPGVVGAVIAIVIWLRLVRHVGSHKAVLEASHPKTEVDALASRPATS